MLCHMKKLAICLLLALGPVCHASITTNNSVDPTCPVRFKSAWIPYTLGLEKALYIHYFNQSTKRIIGIKFGFDMMDAVGDFTPYPEDLTSNDSVKPSKSGSASYNIYDDSSDDGLRIYTKKVLFDDGTTWEDDGKMHCSYVDVEKR